jgi:alpha-L-rhamnosidase
MNKSGLGDRHIESLDSWRQMLDLGLTTFAEKPEPVRSDCHAWSASPNYEFLATVAGIEPVAPGFSPCPDPAASGASALGQGAIAHPSGFEVNFRKDADRISGEISLP